MKVCFKIAIFFVIAMFARALFEQKKSRSYQLKIDSYFHPFISGLINGKSGDFVIDTGGAFFCALDKKTASYLPPSHFLKKTYLYDFRGDIDELEERYCDELEFLGLKVKNFSFIDNFDDTSQRGQTTLEMPQNCLSGFIVSHEHIRCFLGHKFFCSSNFLLDLKHKKLTLYRSGLIPFFSYPYGFFKQACRIPFNYDPKKGPIIDISSKYGSKRLIIDTGAPISILKIDPLLAPSIKSQNSDFLSTMTLDECFIGPKRFKHVTFCLEEGFNFEGVDGILGLDFFKDKRLFINWQEQYLCIQQL